MESKEIILDALKGSREALKTAEIAEICGLKKAEVDKAIKVLKDESLIHSPKRCYYAAK